MDDKEFVKKQCCKCVNKNNDQDLCDIRRTMNGEYRCINFKESKDEESGCL